MTKLGKYELIERLAVGGMAELFKAQMLGDRGFKKTVAIKKILPQLATNATFLDMFADEARITAMLDHPNIVQVFEFDTEDDEPYLVMQLVDGHDLFDLMGKTRKLDQALPPELAVFIAHEILNALDYAHNAEDDEGRPLGIVHRDVSPGNVLISRRGNVMLTDFGIAWAYERHQKTEAGKLKGKFGYMSPEQVTGEPIDARSDVFAAGVLLAEMLINRHLFVGQSDLDILLMVRDADVERLVKHSDVIPGDLMEILFKALALRPNRRYQTARAFRDALSEWLFEARKRVSPTDLADHVVRVRQRIIEQALEQANEVGTGEPLRDGAKGSDVSQQGLDRRPPSSPALAPSPRKSSHGLEGRDSSSPRLRVARGSAPGERDRKSGLDDFGKATKPLSMPAIAEPEPPLVSEPDPRPSGRMSDRLSEQMSERSGGRPSGLGLTDEPSERGEFATIPPMALLYRLATDKASGLLTVERGAASKEAYFQGGHPRFVGSNLPEERLGSYLVEHGAIDREELDEALMMLPHFDHHLLDALISLGFIEPLEALRHLSEQVTAKLVDVCSWSDGSYCWYAGRKTPRKARKLQLDTFTIMGSTASTIAVAEVVEWAKSVRNHRVQQQFAGADLERFGLGDVMMRAQVLLENHQTSVTDLAGRVRDPGARLEFLRALYLLVQSGLAALSAPV